MSYLVLARKYRPQTFDQVFAQEQITQILKNSIEMDRIGHAYLFCGPRGVGKTSMARIFAKTLNCLEDNKELRPCNKCDNCVEITQGISQDVIEIDGASNTGVEDIRELQKELLYATSNSRFKIYIIDEVHMLSKNAFNALLKTLEEPPENVIFIFATTEPHKVLPTIISRCQRFDFKRIPIKKIVASLKYICNSEKINISEDALFYIARLADGSMRDSQSLLDQVLAYGREKIELDDVLEIFGAVPVEVYQQLLHSIHGKNPAVILSLLHNTLAKGTDLQEFLSGLMQYMRNVTLVKIGVEPEEVPPGELDALKQTAELFTEKDLIYLMSLLIRTKVDIKSSNSPVLITEMAFIKLAQIASMGSVEEFLSDIDLSKINAAPQAAYRQQPQRSYTSQNVPQTPIELARSQKLKKEQQLKNNLEQQKREDEELSKKAKEIFSDLSLQKIRQYQSSLAENIAREKRIIGQKMANLELLSFENNVLKIKVVTSVLHSHFTNEKDWLEQKFSKYFGRAIRIEFILDEPKFSRRIYNPTLEQIAEKEPELARNLAKIDPDMQIRSLINDEL